MNFPALAALLRGLIFFWQRSAPEDFHVCLIDTDADALDFAPKSFCNTGWTFP
jgi:hypothetical protein